MRCISELKCHFITSILTHRVQVLPKLHLLVRQFKWQS